MHKSTIGKFAIAASILAWAPAAFAQQQVVVTSCPRPIMPEPYVTVPLPPPAPMPACIANNKTCSRADADSYAAAKAVADKARADKVAAIKGEADAYFNSLVLAIKAFPDYAECEQNRILAYYAAPATPEPAAAPAKK